MLHPSLGAILGIKSAPHHEIPWGVVRKLCPKNNHRDPRRRLYTKVAYQFRLRNYHCTNKLLEELKLALKYRLAKNIGFRKEVKQFFEEISLELEFY